MAKIKIKNLESWWTRGLETPPQSGEATNNILLTPEAYYEKCKEYYLAYYELKKHNEYYRDDPYYKVLPSEEAKALYFRRADGRCGNMKIAETADDFYDFWHNGQSEKWKTDGYNNNTHPTELSPDDLWPRHTDGNYGHFVLYSSVNRYEELYKIWRIINHDGTVELRDYNHFLREFNEEEYLEVIVRSGYYYYRNYPNKLYVNGIHRFDLTSEELKHMENSKTTVQMRRESFRRSEKKWEKERKKKAVEENN